MHQTWLRSIWLTKQKQTAAQVEAVRRILIRQYGRATRTAPLERIKQYGVIAEWENPHTSLALSVARHQGRYRSNRSYVSFR